MSQRRTPARPVASRCRKVVRSRQMLGHIASPPPCRAFHERVIMCLRRTPTSLAMPLRSLIAVISVASIAVWAFFGIQESLNTHSTKLELMEKDLKANSEFRVQWPRGLLGSLPADAEQFLLIKELYRQTDKLQLRVDSMLHNEINIESLSKAVDKLQRDVEKLKDKQREFVNNRH